MIRGFRRIRFRAKLSLVFRLELCVDFKGLTWFSSLPNRKTHKDTHKKIQLIKPVPSVTSGAGRRPRSEWSLSRLSAIILAMRLSIFV